MVLVASKVEDPPVQAVAENMKIAFIRYRYDPFGGAERFTQVLIESLARRGAEIHLFARKWSQDSPPSIHFHRIGGPNRPRLLGHASFAFFTARAVARERFDLVQSNEHTLCQHLYRAGDGVHARWLELRGRFKSAPKRLWLRLSPFHIYKRRIERRLFEHPKLKAVIVNSQMVRDEILERFDIPASHIHTIYNGVDLERFNPSRRSDARLFLQKKYRLDATAPVVLFVGSGFERKGLSFLIEAMALAGGNAKLWVVGKNKTKKYEKQAERLGIGGRVVFFGPQKDVAPFFAASDIFVLPTLYDPFPTVVLEAMASGLPVITTAQCGAAEILSQGKDGFVLASADEVSEMARFLAVLFKKEVREAMSIQARKRAEDFSIERTISELESLYEKLLNQEQN